ncbi:NHLP bacteriocin export ABC transporter permease/ATPase subunit [Desulfovibrio inopinatus]|uniref:NHLP bacteriocin export ABC transporter permease/ATPase subunit n=1 Tax=Desulfovibrio inopinatus TaxID=102109 RepID=UPI000481B63E|nr:NHLP bacteriocin export ABC transporter permease/ATPase subunit [Desulfovibrio inopinatus]
MTDVHAFFEQHGVMVESQGNTPVDIHDTDSVWLVVSGAVEIYCRKIGPSPSQRHHLGSITSGQLLFGISPQTAGLEILAIGQQHTTLRRVSFAHFLRTFSNITSTQQVAAHVDDWVTTLCNGAVREILRTQIPAAARSEVLDLLPGQIVCAKRTVLWTDVEKGSALFLGMVDVASHCEGDPPICKTPFFPITPNAWLNASTAVTLRFHKTEELIHHPDFLKILQNFHSLFLQAHELNHQLIRVDEFNRIRERAASAKRSRESAQEKLSTVLAAEEEAILRQSSHDPLFAACRLIGHQLGVTVHWPNKSKFTTRQNAPTLDDILHVSCIRGRKIRLRGKWWKKDISPLLVYFSEDGRPAALLHDTRNQCVIVDPTRGERSTLNSRVAQSLNTMAWCLYPPLPDRSVGSLDLIRFALRDIRSDLYRLFLSGFVACALGALFPFGFQYLAQVILPQGELNKLFTLCITLFLSMIAASLLEVSRNFDVLRIEARMDSWLQSAIVDRVLRLPPSFHRQYVAGDLTSRVLSIGHIRLLLSGSTIVSLLGAVFSVMYLAILFFFSLELASFVLIVVLLAVCINIAGSALQVKHLRIVTHLEGWLSGFLLQLVTGISKLRVSGAEAHGFARWAKSFTRQRRAMLATRRLANILQAFNEALPALLTLILFLALWGTTVQESVFTGRIEMSSAEFIGFNMAMLAFTVAFLTTATSVTSILQIIPLYERMRPLLETEPESCEEQLDPGQLSGALEVSNVSYSYAPHDPPALQSISFAVQPGEFVAFVGPSGSGKSTLLRILLGFCKPDSGMVLYDGKDLAVIENNAVRSQFGVVLQNAQVIPGDIFMNIVGSRDLTLDDAWEAARMAGMDETIRNLPMGMNTILGNGLSTFSGGERQRLLLARALVGKPTFIMLDEATSALDNQTQSQVTQSLEQRSATRIVIAHRLSTIRNADRIYVMNKGEIVEYGSFDELVQKKGLFLDLIKRQVI